MRRASVPGVTLQITILFVATLIVTQLLQLGHRYFIHTEALAALEVVRIADRIAIATALLDNTDTTARPQLVDLHDGSNLLLAWSQEPWVDNESAPDQMGRLLLDLVAGVVSGTSGRDVRVGYATHEDERHEHETLSRNWRHLRIRPAPLGHVVEEFVKDPTFLVSVQLRDGSWLNVTAAYTDTLDFWPFEQVALLGAMVLLVSVLSIWAIRRMTTPFRLFASAAARLGTDVNAAPIQPQGPAEVRSAIEAFNEMQQRLQRFIGDRMQMVAAMSHDLRTPLTRLRLRTEYLRSAKQRSKARADLDEMEQMIAEVLSFVRDDSKTEATECVDITSVIRSICAETQNCTFSWPNESEHELRVFCRPNAIRRCLTNLIDNAVKYGQSARIDLEEGSDQITVIIDDRGPGIPAELCETVFLPFFRVETSRNRSTGGTGLGLSVARTIARAHGGDVNLEKIAGGGLRVSLRLPKSFPELAGVPGGC